MSCEDGLGGEVFGDQGLADAVLSDEDDVGGVGEPGESTELFDEVAIDGTGPCPVEVGEGFGGPEAGSTEAPFEAAASALLDFPVEKPLESFEFLSFFPMSEQAVRGRGCVPDLEEDSWAFLRVIAVETMRGDFEVAEALGQVESQLDGLACVPLSAIEDHADSGRVRGSRLERLADGGGQSVGAVIVEQTEQLVDSASQALLTLGESDEELFSSGDEP
jgi:hypothetical protein